MENPHGHYAFFSHTSCEFFPCHKGIDPQDFNCLFCFCPLYRLGESCGGNFRMLPNGVKDCSACAFPHVRGNYDTIMQRLASNAE